MPRTMMGFALMFTGPHQAGLAVLSIAVFALSAVPLELQRRLINDLANRSGIQDVLRLALCYAGVALAEQLLKLGLNLYRAWVAETTVWRLRDRIGRIEPSKHTVSGEGVGVEIAMIVEEAEPIGGFTGISLSEPLLQGGILVSVIGYMFILQPWLALLGLVFFVPQTIVVPLLQAAINRRAQARILVKREVSSALADVSAGNSSTSVPDGARRIFTLNMGIYWFKYVMNLVMNLMHHFSIAAALGVGGWMVFDGRIEVGTVVAVAAGLGKLNDPWGDLVNWAREFSVVSVKYRLFADAVIWLGEPVAA
ncbi:MAG TPA: ABC transporter transmembrane domain-containing protein [Gemmataceae bacterium]|jgi:ABC-type multidrug transport system fused ATPase/permease subunit|nr:ABC transporter transmembrane domain-containing protein [Gemmataceae bacterium]